MTLSFACDMTNHVRRAYRVRTLRVGDWAQCDDGRDGTTWLRVYAVAYAGKRVIGAHVAGDTFLTTREILRVARAECEDTNPAIALGEQCPCGCNYGA